MFGRYLNRWNLVPDGEAIHTHSSDLLPVQFEGKPAMLKVARSDEEATGNNLMVWLNGRGAAHVYAHEGEAMVLERLNTEPSLTDMVNAGQDDEATRLLCRAAAELHRVSEQKLNCRTCRPCAAGSGRWRKQPRRAGCTRQCGRSHRNF